jgi:hypothetical protein
MKINIIKLMGINLAVLLRFSDPILFLSYARDTSASY